MRSNLLTKVNNRILHQLEIADKKLKEMNNVPYMARPATLKEQRQAFEGLTEEGLYDLIRRHGEESVNKWLEQMNRRTDGKPNSVGNTDT